MRKFLKLTVFVAFAAIGQATYANVTSVGSQATFSALGTIAQNTNWDAYGSGFSFPGSPFTVGDLTFVAGVENIIGGTGTTYNLARNLLTDNNFAGTTAVIASTYDLFAVNAGNFFDSGTATFTVTTNLGNYSFNEFVFTAVDGAPLTFLGFHADAGEYFTAVNWSGLYATGVTDIQLGITAVPEPEIYAMMGIGLALIGFVARRKRELQDRAAT
jgi:hypothetical protein